MSNGLELREELAAIQHEIWSHWMKYLFSVCIDLPGDDMVIPKDFVSRWDRQVATPYCELSEAERESDREQADKVLAVLQGR